MRAWALPRAALALIAVVLVGQVVALVSGQEHSAILLVSLVLLDGLGLVYSWRASYRCASRTTWRLLAAGRGLSLASTSAFTADAVRHDPFWWWVGVACGLSMFLALTAAVLSLAALRLGSQRWAFLAEVVTVVSSGFLLIWYLLIHPVTTGHRAHVRWLFELGFPLANLLLLSAVAAVLLRTGIAGLTRPLIAATGGILLYAVSDVGFTAVQLHGARGAHSAPAEAGLVLASLLMTVAAMWQAGAPSGRELPTIRMPAWSAQAPFVAVGLGNLVVLLATLSENHVTVWTGLILGQIVMSAALAARQIVFLRESRRQNVTDALTGLANVTGLREAVRRTMTGGGDHALLLIDLDGFKEINDGYGHAAGDRVLVTFARLLRGSVRQNDLAARVGGDEFVVLLPGAAQRSAVAVAERLLATLAQHPVAIGPDTVTIQASIGLATATTGETPDDLQRRADLAMYESKRTGSAGWKAYHPSMTDRRSRDRMIGERILPALAAGQFEVWYQPLVRMSSGETIGLEALLRWHTDLGPISPVEFIPIAERTGAIVELGRWVLEQAAGQVQQWRAASGRDLYVSVNVSPRQLQEQDVVPDVRAILDRTGLPAGRLCLEITESAIVDENVAIPALVALRGHGVQVAIDDFGTGYSSLHYLTRLPVDVLKIDRSFVAQLDTTPQGAGVTEAVIRLAQVLGLHVLAEGIETPEQSAELQMLGCDIGQGYLFARPLSAAQVAAEFSRTDATL